MKHVPGGHQEDTRPFHPGFHPVAPSDDAAPGAGAAGSGRVVTVTLSGVPAPGDLPLRIRAALRAAFPDPLLWPDIDDVRGGIVDVLQNLPYPVTLRIVGADALRDRDDREELMAIARAAPGVRVEAVVGDGEGWRPHAPTAPASAARVRVDAREAVVAGPRAWADDPAELAEIRRALPGSRPLAALLALSPRLDRLGPAGDALADADVAAADDAAQDAAASTDPDRIATLAVASFRDFTAGRLEQAFGRMERLSDALRRSTDPQHAGLRAMGWLIAGTVRHPRRTPGEAIAAFERSAREAELAGLENLRRLAVVTRAYALSVSGSTVEGSLSLAGLREPKRGSPLRIAARTLVAVAEGDIALDRLDLASARAGAARAQRRAPQHFPALYLDHLLASIDFYAGAPAAGFGRLQQRMNQDAALFAQFSLPLWLYQRASAEMLLALGEETRALEVLDRGENEYLYHHPYLSTARATALFRLGRVREAEEIVQRHLWQESTSARNRMALLLVDAQFHLFMNRRREAARSFEAAIELVVYTQSYRPFALVPRDVLDELMTLVPSARDRLAPVVAWSLPRAPIAQAAALTRRELAVLQVLADGASNADIAARLQVSENTVKSQLRAVFRKLGAMGRDEAVVRAVSLGILDAPPRG